MGISFELGRSLETEDKWVMITHQYKFAKNLTNSLDITNVVNTTKTGQFASRFYIENTI